MGGSGNGKTVATVVLTNLARIKVAPTTRVPAMSVPTAPRHPENISNATKVLQHLPVVQREIGSTLIIAYAKHHTRTQVLVIKVVARFTTTGPVTIITAL